MYASILLPSQPHLTAQAQNTNVVKFFSLLKKEPEQLCYYQAGIGTYSDPSILSPAFLWLAKVLDEAIAWYAPLSSH